MRRLKFRKPARAAAVAVAALMVLGVAAVLGQNSFTDVQSEDARRADILYASQQGWFQGYPDGSFRPDAAITEQQLARVIARAYPGLTRGDAAVFLRGGMDRMRAAGITTTTTTTLATTTAATAAAPGDQGPGGGGPVDPNPPVVIEPTTTAAASATTAASTTTAPAVTTTTQASAAKTLAYGRQGGWTNSRGRTGEIVWWEFQNWDSSAKNARITMGHGGALLIYDGDGHIGGTPYWFRGSGGVGISSVRCEGSGDQTNVEVPCTTVESSTMPASVRKQLIADGFTHSSSTTTTTAAPATTTTTTAPATTTTTAASGAKQLVYGKEGGWTNSRGQVGDVVWWDFQNWGSSPKNAGMRLSYGSYLYVYDDRAHVGGHPYWFRDRGYTLRYMPTTLNFSISSVYCISASQTEAVPCTTTESSTMPASVRKQLIADGFTHSSSTTTTTTAAPTTTTTTTTTTPAATTTTQASASKTFVYGTEDGWRNSLGRTGQIVWWDFQDWDSSARNARIKMNHGGYLYIYNGNGHVGSTPYWFRMRPWATFVGIASVRCEGSGSQTNVEVPCTTRESSTMPTSVRNRLTADGYRAPS